jgi:hypothetical protein
LGESEHTLKFYDALPEKDRVMFENESSLYRVLIKKRRYQDVIELESTSRFLANLDSYEDEARGIGWTKDKPEAQESIRDLVIRQGAERIEVLLGTQQIKAAEELRERLLKLDSSKETRDLIEKHQQRAIKG